MKLRWGGQKSEDARPGGHEVTFDIAPDGRQIAFSATDGNLYLLDLQALRVTSLTQAGQGVSPAFSPDGTKIVYAATASGESGPALYEFSLKTKTKHRLTSDSKVSDSQPSYSPDGTWVTFTRAFLYRRYSMGGMIWSDYDVCMIRADGTGLKRLTNKKYYSAVCPSFSRDGKEILFSAALPYNTGNFDENSGGSMPTILRVSASVAGEPRIILPLPKPGKHGGAHATDLDLSPGGQSIAFISDRAEPFQYDICTVDRNGANLRSLHITKISSYNQQPTYLPDGKSLLFLAATEDDARGGQLFSLWRVSADGSRPQRVANESLFVNPLGWKPRAPELNDLKSVRAALATGVSPDSRDALGKSLLSRAASRGDVEVVRLLLQKGANPNAPDTDGSTVLVRALEKENNLDIIRLLIAKGVKVNTRSQGENLKDMPPLILATMGGNIPIVEALIRAGADIKAVDSGLGSTALHWACHGDKVALVRLFLDKGVPVDVRDSMGSTPLMAAAMSGKPELVKLLIARGAKVRARDDQTRQMYGRAQFMGDQEEMDRIRKSGKLDKLHEDGRSVLEFAQIGGNAEVIALIKKAGATE